ncbi:MAG: hypothetical protein MUF31_14830 [Akkermansiaceae bacterium]|jgi:hypothetical protein|nr:hypothetical protein [Akkermansiaceae bacterium]
MKAILFLIAGLLTLPASSQEPRIKTEIVTVALDDLVTDLFFHNGKDISHFKANPTGLGEPLKYEGPRRFVLRKSEEEFSLDPLPAPTAFIDLPADSNRILLICSKPSGKPLKLVAYDIGSARIKEGEYRFFNFSHSVVSAILGGRKFAVKPGADRIVSDASWEDEILELDVDLAVIRDNKAKRVYSSQWGHRPGRRNYIFLFDGPQAYKPLRICRFFDVPPAAPAAAESR